MKTIYSAIFTVLFILTINNIAISQEVEADTTQQKQMQFLSFMEGNWEGSGWIMGADRQKHKFEQTESISFKLEKTVLLIEGRGISNGQIMHDALAIINYDREKGHYNFRSYLKDGRSGDYKAELIDNKLFWYPTDFIRYIISITENNEWNEIGEINKGGSWYKFFDMTLTKK